MTYSSSMNADGASLLAATPQQLSNPCGASLRCDAISKNGFGFPTSTLAININRRLTRSSPDPLPFVACCRPFLLVGLPAAGAALLVAAAGFVYLALE